MYCIMTLNRKISGNAAATLDMASTDLSTYITGSLHAGSGEFQIEIEILNSTLQNGLKALF